ncbi:MAG: iron-sulfur cluster assembly accessory protein [Hyphomicrobiales bacterium]|nr:iron-sulfur cluster assembly accessory protein [Hyphomicrobiales bacterium]
MTHATNESSQAQPRPIVTERAAKRVAAILKREAEGAMLRVAVNGGGCSGFQYAFDIETNRAPDDLAIESEGATVLIDPVSLDFLRGARIDFVDDLIGQSFKIDNPNATSSCGCGTSFSV